MMLFFDKFVIYDEEDAQKQIYKAKEKSEKKNK
jgi:hypothetical protein